MGGERGSPEPGRPRRSPTAELSLSFCSSQPFPAWPSFIPFRLLSSSCPRLGSITIACRRTHLDRFRRLQYTAHATAKRRGYPMRTLSIAAAGALFALTSSVSALPFSDPRADRIPALDANAVTEQRDPGCRAATLVSAGGMFPRNPHTLAVRWIGFSNYELVYNNRVILLDAYIDRGSFFPPLGVKAADMKKADVVLIGHGHVDHMSDAASIGAQTKAMVVGAPMTTEKLATQAIPRAQVKTVTGKGGEVMRFDGFTVEPILGRHGE